MVLPIERIVRELNERGIDTLVDGAHTAGMIPLDVEQMNAAYYTGNCHKWLCAPKGVAFLHARRDRQKSVRPTVISHGANSSRKDRSRFLIEFDWMGTGDPTGVLCLPFLIEYMKDLVPGGWPAIMRRNRELVLAARRLICESWEIRLPCPDEMIGSLASFPIPDAESTEPPKSALYLDPWQDELMARHNIEVPILPWPQPPRRLLRISAQLYNSLPQYGLLAEAVKELRQ
jgi:isopenicillin-N epimerase